MSAEATELRIKWSFLIKYWPGGIQTKNVVDRQNLVWSSIPWQENLNTFLLKILIVFLAICIRWRNEDLPTAKRHFPCLCASLVKKKNKNHLTHKKAPLPSLTWTKGSRKHLEKAKGRQHETSNRRYIYHTMKYNHGTNSSNTQTGILLI